MREFVDTQLIPLEPIYERLPPDEWRVVQTYLQRQVEQRGLWGAFLDPELGGPGFGQLKLALMSEIIGRCMMSMGIFGVQAPDSGNMELLAHGATDGSADGPGVHRMDQLIESSVPNEAKNSREIVGSFA